MPFSDKVFKYDINIVLNHIGQIDHDDTFAKIAANDKHLNMLIFVVSFDFLSIVMTDERK